jgi:hypothetical protein
MTLRRTVEIVHADDLMKRFEERIQAGFLYGDFQFSIDGKSPDFLRRGATREQVAACYAEFEKFLELKEKHDPAGLFQSDWYRHYRTLFTSA